MIKMRLSTWSTKQLVYHIDSYSTENGSYLVVDDVMIIIVLYIDTGNILLKHRSKYTKRVMMALDFLLKFLSKFFDYLQAIIVSLPSQPHISHCSFVKRNCTSSGPNFAPSFHSSPTTLTPTTPYMYPAKLYHP